MSRQPLPLSHFSDVLKRHLNPNSPTPLRLMAAKGLVPMAPPEMVGVLYQLGLDKSKKVSSAARASMQGTPPDILKIAVAGDVPGPALDWVAELFPKRDDILQTLVHNPATDDATITRIARAASERLCDLIAQNQVRLLRSPKIIESLYLNVQARMSTIDKIVDLARRNEVNLEGLPGLKPLLESTVDIVAEADTTTDFNDEAFAENLHEAEVDSLADEAEDDAKESGKEPPEDAKSNDRSRQAFLTSLRVSEKVRFATLGSREDRKYLIRDSNRLVHMAAIASPKVNENDALSWSSNRSLADGIINYIANRRDWVRHYQVKVNLVNNPKLALQKSLRFLNHLYPKDLKLLTKNRNVPAQLSRQAKTLMEKRSGGRRR